MKIRKVNIIFVRNDLERKILNFTFENLLLKKITWIFNSVRESFTQRGFFIPTYNFYLFSGSLFPFFFSFFRLYFYYCISIVHNCNDHSHLHLLISNLNVWYQGIHVFYSCLLFITHGLIMNRHNDELPVSFLAQMVEHCTGITELMDSTPAQALIYFHYS